VRPGVATDGMAGGGRPVSGFPDSRWRACRSRMKIPVVHSSASVFRTDGVLTGHGPSSRSDHFLVAQEVYLLMLEPNPGPPVSGSRRFGRPPSAFGLVQRRAQVERIARRREPLRLRPVAALLPERRRRSRCVRPVVAGCCRSGRRQEPRRLWRRRRLRPCPPDESNDTAPAKTKPAARTHGVFPKSWPVPEPCFRRPSPLPAPMNNTLIWSGVATARGDMPGRFAAEPVNSGVRQRPARRAVFTLVSCVHRFREDVRDITVMADEVFVEVPARNILRPRLRRHL